MDVLQAMRVFKSVAETGSFSKAADTLHIARASATMTIQKLEAHLKARLVHRTTRSLNLTPEGAAYYERCVRILTDVEEAESLFGQAGLGPRGKLRIDMPVMLRVIVLPQIGDFRARYPNIELMLGFNDRPIDLVHEGVDCALRIGALRDSSLMSRRIGTYRTVTVASPEYLARQGTPSALADLSDHVAVNYFWAGSGRLMDLSFTVDGGPITVKMNGAFAVNDTDAYLQSGLDGYGLIQAPLMIAWPHLEAGRLIKVLGEFAPLTRPISALYPTNRHLSPAVRVFVDWVAEVFERSALV
uniref:Transcriptional regulator, LysR family n=1 Tax=Caulobacter sp. (strain K31) TaxID=366602 RepID=B0T965_CAUSK